MKIKILVTGIIGCIVLISGYYYASHFILPKEAGREGMVIYNISKADCDWRMGDYDPQRFETQSQTNDIKKSYIPLNSNIKLPRWFGASKCLLPW